MVLGLRAWMVVIGVAGAVVCLALLAVGLWVSPVLAASIGILLLVALSIFDYLNKVRR